MTNNYIKAKIDNKHQEIYRSLCGDKDETINHKLNECPKVEQKEDKTSHNWVGKGDQLHR